MPKVETFDKSLVIEQATNVFHEKGFNGTSMQDLVDATGLNRSSVYNSFGSKLNIFLECLNSYQEKNTRSTTKLLLDSNTGIEAVQNLFDYFLQSMFNSGNEKGCLIANCKSEMAYQNESITKFLVNNQKNTLSLFEDMVERGQVDGSINVKQSRTEYALYLFSCLQGFRMTGILMSDQKQLRGVIKTTLQTLK